MRVRLQKEGKAMTIQYESDDKSFPAEAYKVDGYPGVAWSVLGWEVEADEDTEWTGYLVKTGQIVAVMIGDDRKFTFSPDEVKAIDEQEYCHECGQIGCKADSLAEV